MKLSEKLKNSIPQLTGDFETFKKTVDELMLSVNSEKEKDLIAEFVADAINADAEQLIVDTKILLLKLQLNEYQEIIPYSYIAKKYFQKSKSWLSQRVNGYDVNRKKTKFTPEELDIFIFSLKDIGNVFGSITLK
ncbi:DUF5053 domain-containing protein [Viscerimonas tarda]